MFVCVMYLYEWCAHVCVCVCVMFSLCNNTNIFHNLSANTPDVVIDEESRTVSILEVGCTLDFSLEEAFLTKPLKYQPLVSAMEQLAYKCKLLVFIFGSLGNVHRRVVCM